MTESRPIDDDALEALASGLPAGSLDAVLGSFAADLARHRLAVEHALRGRDLARLHALAHAVAGSAATFCARPLATVAGQVQELAAAGEWQAVAAAGNRLVVEADRVVAGLAERLAGRPGAAP